MTEATQTPAKKAAAAPLPGAPAAAPKKERTEKLFVSYTADDDSPNSHSTFDAVIFGRKIDALEHASEQDIRWKVIELAKGQSIRDAIASKA